MAEEIADTEGVEEGDEFSPTGTIYLNTHEHVNHDLSGSVEKLEAGYAKVNLLTIDEMRADKHDLVHGGFIFSAADFAAMVAVNERNVVLAASECQFLSPVRVGDEVVIEAKVRHKEGRKRNVHVEAYVFDIKVFEGEFKTVVTENHVLKLSLLKEAKVEE